MFCRALFLMLLAFGLLPCHGQGLKIRMKGSDSIDPLIRLWASEFQKLRPEVQFDIESKGSGTAPQALLEDQADLGHMSREMNATEQGIFLARVGAPALGVTVAYDALAIFVHRDNPVKRLSIEQLDAIYSSTRKAGWEEPLTTWGDLRLRRPLGSLEIHPLCRDERSGSQAFFLEKVLQKEGSLRGSVQVKDQVGILETIGHDPQAIGYGPESYANPLVRMVPLVGLLSGKAFLPTQETIQDGRYALSRRLFIYAKRQPGKALPEHVSAFLGFILSSAGQELARRHGSVPLGASVLAQESSRLQ